MDARNIRKVVAWLLVAAWAAVIFAMSAKSGLDLDSGTGVLSMAKRWLAGSLSDLLGRPVDPSPLGHFAEYLVFGGLLANALRHAVRPSRVVASAIAIAAAYAFADELHQLFVPGRSCDPLDWMVDVTAASLAALVVWLVAGRRHNGATRS